MVRFRHLLPALAAAAPLFALPAHAVANAGEFDPSFGMSGVAVASIPEAANLPRDMAIDGKGRIVLAGCRAHFTSEQPVVVRFLPDGSLDPSFGRDGVVEPESTFSLREACSEAVAIDSSGRIVLGGAVRAGREFNFAVGRLLEDGSADPSFGQDGLLTAYKGPGWDWGTDVAIDGQGRILLGGDIQKFGGEAERGAAIRVTPDGSLDPSFGTDGIAVVDFGGEGNAEAIAVEPSGAVLLAGAATISGTQLFALARLDSQGNPDPSLGGDGRVAIDPPGPPGGKAAVAIAVDGSGRLLLTGTEGPEGGEVAPVIRLLPDGSLDPSFGIGGALLLSPTPGAEAGGVAVDPEGRIVVAGGVRSGKAWEAFLARLDSNGTRDASFGQDGIVRDSRLISPISPAVQAVAVDSAGRYLVTAGVQGGFGVARYLPEASVPVPLPRYRCRGRQATIVGTRGRDVLKGTKGRDVVVGFRGDDVIRGFGGKDLICGGAGRDRLFGGKGNDQLFGGEGADLLVGGRGRDRIRGGPGRDIQR